MSDDKDNVPFVTKGLILQVLWIVLIGRLFISFTLPGYNGLVLSEWIDVTTWIGPVVIALGMVFGYWRYYKKGEYPFER